MRKIIIRYKNKSIRVIASEDNTCIVNSYRIEDKNTMKDVLSKIKKSLQDDSSLAIHKRSMKSMIREWRVHNLLYSLNIQRDRTESVDLDINQPWYIKVAYFLLSPLYLHFS